MASRTPLPVALRDSQEPPPDDWFLSDGFNMPITPQTQRRNDVVQSSFEVRIAREGRDATVLANVALRWDESHKRVGVDPDVMWVEPAPPPRARSVFTWKVGMAPPRVAVEIVSRRTAAKDYQRGPEKYGASGTRELWVFDPEGYGRTADGRGPWKLQVWRRARGEFRCVYRGDGPFRSKELGAWIVVVGDLLRVADDEAGARLWPTAHELAAEEETARAEAEHQRAEAERQREAEANARAEAERQREAEANARAEAERRAMEAEARVRALEAALRQAATAPQKKAPRRRGR